MGFHIHILIQETKWTGGPCPKQKCQQKPEERSCCPTAPGEATLLLLSSAQSGNGPAQVGQYHDHDEQDRMEEDRVFAGDICPAAFHIQEILFPSLRFARREITKVCAIRGVGRSLDFFINLASFKGKFPLCERKKGIRPSAKCCLLS